jgi:hypothetical protein
MIYIPLVYFSLLLLLIIRIKRRFELAATISSAFIITSTFAIIIDINNLYGSAGAVQATIGVIPTLLYIGLITTTIIPFLFLPALKKERIAPISNMRLFNNIVYFFALVTVFSVILFWGEIFKRLTSPDIDQLRILYAAGEDDLGFSQYSGIFRTFARFIFVLGSEALLLQILYFYSITMLNKDFKYNLAILISSTTPVIISMLSFDRSKIFYWALSYLALTVFFWPAMSTKQKRVTQVNAFVFSVIFLIYITTITIARYGIQDVGGLNSIIVYAGQSFNNFCLFYEKIAFDTYNFDKIIPLLNSWLSLSPQNLVINHSIDVAVFASFAGIVMKDIGILGAILYCLIYFVVASMIFSKIKYYNITWIFLVTILLYVPYLGIFGIYYANVQKEMAVWVSLIITYFLRHKII